MAKEVDLIHNMQATLVVVKLLKKIGDVDSSLYSECQNYQAGVFYYPDKEHAQKLTTEISRVLQQKPKFDKSDRTSAEATWHEEVKIPDLDAPIKVRIRVCNYVGTNCRMVKKTKVIPAQEARTIPATPEHTEEYEEIECGNELLVADEVKDL